MAPRATWARKSEGPPPPGAPASGRLPVAAGSAAGRLEYWAVGRGAASPGSALAPADHRLRRPIPAANARAGAGDTLDRVVIEAPCLEPPISKRRRMRR